MKKNIVQDVIPGKKSIRNVDLPSRNRSSSPEDKKEPTRTRKQTPQPEDEFTRPVKLKQEAPIKIEREEAPLVNIPTPSQPPRVPPEQTYSYEFDEPARKGKKVMYGASLVLLVAIAFAISGFFQSAKVTITPEQQIKPLNDTFVAKKDVSPNSLSFQTVTLTKEVEQPMDAQTTMTEQQVDKKATGKIVIYNTSPQIQKLVATTRFETPEGLIFRIVSPVTIPAASTQNGKMAAGSVEATVEADKSGDMYNIGLKDFTVPGLKGDPKFKQIYARSKTEMNGGFSGVQKVVTGAVSAHIDQDMATTLKEALLKDISAQIPADYVLYPDDTQFKFEPVTVVGSGNAAVIKKKGTATAIIFNRAILTHAIAQKILPEAADEPIRISNLDDLKFAYASSTAFDAAISTSASFTLKGDANLVWVFDESKLKSDILGLSKNSAKNVISQYGTVKEAWIETHPFWKQSIPLDPAKVTIVNTLTK